MACISHFCFIKIKVMSRVYFTISRGKDSAVFTNPMTFLFLLSLSHFKILLASKYLLMFFHLDRLRSRCYFAFCLQMFPLRNPEKSNFPLAKITIKSPLPLVQCKLFWLCRYSVLIQPWCMS